jgi:hypothetical protein
MRGPPLASFPCAVADAGPPEMRLAPRTGEQSKVQTRVTGERKGELLLSCVSVRVCAARALVEPSLRLCWTYLSVVNND